MDNPGHPYLIFAIRNPYIAIHTYNIWITNIQLVYIDEFNIRNPYIIFLYGTYVPTPAGRHRQYTSVHVLLGRGPHICEARSGSPQ